MSNTPTTDPTTIRTFSDLRRALPLRQLRGQSVDSGEIQALLTDPDAPETSPTDLPAWGEQLLKLAWARQGHTQPTALARSLEAELERWTRGAPQLNTQMIHASDLTTRVALLTFSWLLSHQDTTPWALEWCARIPHLAEHMSLPHQTNRDRTWLRGQLARNLAPGQQPRSELAQILLIRSNAFPQDWRDVASRTWQTHPLPTNIGSATDLVPWMHLTPVYSSAGALLPGRRSGENPQLSGLAKALSGREVPLDDNGQIRISALWITLLEAAIDSADLPLLRASLGADAATELSALLKILHGLTSNVTTSAWFTESQRNTHARMLSAAWQAWEAAGQALSAQHSGLINRLRPHADHGGFNEPTTEDPQREADTGDQG